MRPIGTEQFVWNFIEEDPAANPEGFSYKPESSFIDVNEALKDIFDANFCRKQSWSGSISVLDPDSAKPASGYGTLITFRRFYLKGWTSRLGCHRSCAFSSPEPWTVTAIGNLPLEGLSLLGMATPRCLPPTGSACPSLLAFIVLAECFC